LPIKAKQEVGCQNMSEQAVKCFKAKRTGQVQEGTGLVRDAIIPERGGPADSRKMLAGF